MIDALPLLAYAEPAQNTELAAQALKNTPILIVLMIPLAGIFFGCMVAIVKSITSHIRRKQMAEIEGTLKLEMIQRGMSADEISQVLSARMAGFKDPASSKQPIA